MSKKNLGWIVPLIGILIFAGFWAFTGCKFCLNEPIEEQSFGGEPLEERDVFGTQTGTSTVPTSSADDEDYNSEFPAAVPNSNFSDLALNEDNGYSTTSKVVMLNGTTDEVLFTFRALTASSTGSFYYEIFGSNDNDATTTATSTTDNDYNPLIPIKSEINWYNVGADAALVSGALTSPGSGGASTTSEILTGLNWKYLKVELRGASTTVSVRLREKINY